MAIADKSKTCVVGCSAFFCAVGVALLIAGMIEVYGIDPRKLASGTNQPGGAELGKLTTANIASAALFPAFVSCSETAAFLHEPQYNGTANELYIDDTTVVDRLASRCRMGQVGPKYFVVLSAVFVAVTTVVVLSSLCLAQNNAKLLHCSVYLIAVGTALLLLSIMIISVTTTTAAAKYVSCSSETAAEKSDLAASGFFCLEDRVNNQPVEQVAEWWLSMVGLSYAGAVLALVGLWMLVSAVTFFLDESCAVVAVSAAASPRVSASTMKQINPA